MFITSLFSSPLEDWLKLRFNIKFYKRLIKLSIIRCVTNINMTLGSILLFSHWLFLSPVPIVGSIATQVYDSFTGSIMSQRVYEEHVKLNRSFWCANEIAPCDPLEGRRVDGTCNNLRFPSRGASHTPTYNILPPVYDKDFQLRKDKNGEELPLSRKVRTTLLSEGRMPDTEFTHLVTYFSVFVAGDVHSFHDTINYVYWTKHCCEEKGKTDPQCASIVIPEDDPVHRFTGERCLNLTTPWTFQSLGCTMKNTRPEKIVSATPFFDLSQLYGSDNNKLKTKVRLFKDGLLKYEKVEGSIWPPTHGLDASNAVCHENVAPKETRCHDTGFNSNNSILGINLFTIWIWRHHNHVASQLARLNPCWGDERLFHTARDISIAVVTQIFYYELTALLLGEENLYQDGVLSSSFGHRDLYDENLMPAIALEYSTVLRWMHTVQEGMAKMYDNRGNYIKSKKIVDLTLRTGYLAVDKNLHYLTQGAFRQRMGKIDSTIDPDMAGKGFPLQYIVDLATNDLSKNRLFGVAPYIAYRKACFGEDIRTFEDLEIAIDQEKIDLLRELYSSVEDIELLAGVWTERAVRGARVPATFYCIVAEQLRHFAASDRHWYEAADRPAAFTLRQLLEIRKATVARLLCDVGDGVTSIQPRAFLVPGPGNEFRSCDEIESIDLSAWEDPKCEVWQNKLYNDVL